MRTCARALLTAAACGATLPARADGQTSPAPAVIGIDAVDSLVSAEFAKDSIGSLTVGVVVGARLAWTRSVGFADMKARRLASRSTVYRIGSVTKPFTAVMPMQLVAAGRVRLSDPVERHLPGIGRLASKPRAAAPITFLQLATMTAGLAREARDGRGYKVPNGAIFSTVDDLARFVAFELGRGPERVVPTAMLDDAFGGLVATDHFLELGYGLGFMAKRRDGYPYLGHDGSIPGYRASMYFDRGMKLGVIVLRNVGGGRQNADRLAVDILSLLAARKAVEIQADIDRRFRAQTAFPGSDAAVRRLVEELRIAKPDYERMSVSEARGTRRQLEQHRATFARLGALQSLTFTGVGAAGPTIYRTTFEQGALEWRIWMNLDGTVDAFRYREVPRGTSP